LSLASCLRLRLNFSPTLVLSKVLLGCDSETRYLQRENDFFQPFYSFVVRDISKRIDDKETGVLWRSFYTICFILLQRIKRDALFSFTFCAGNEIALF